MGTELQTRQTVDSLMVLKNEMLREIEIHQTSERRLSGLYQTVGGFSPIRGRYEFGYHGDKAPQKHVDRAIWKYLTKVYHLEKFMLTTDWEKLQKQVDNFETPEFNADNANAWIAGLKGLIYDNVKTLVHKVFQIITEGHYYVGGGYNAIKKKRNNNGVDTRFILRTGDESSIGGYCRGRPTQTDDLEKVNYILDGKSLPDKTLKQRMADEKVRTLSDDYMTVKVCDNGNTHYHLTDVARDRINRFGPEGAIIGENIKIKVFE